MYDLDGRARALYEGMRDHFKLELTDHAFRPFGCDHSHINARQNYAISDALIAAWNRLGFNETMELVYSTPSRYVQAIAKVNNEEWNKTGETWPIRREGTLPYA